MKTYTLLLFMAFLVMFKLQAQEERKDFKRFYDQHQASMVFGFGVD